MAKNKNSIMEDIRGKFTTPPDEFYPLVCWCWLGKMTESLIRRQLRNLRSKGFREALIYPGFGMPFPYLSAKYFELVKYAVQQAAASGMKIWLYDEYNWPSGAAAGKVIRNHPEYKMVYLQYSYNSIRKQDKNRNMDVNLPGGSVICVRAVSVREARRKEIDLTCKTPKDSTSLKWTAPEGDWEVVAFAVETCEEKLEYSIGEEWVKPVSGYTDTLNREAVALFLKLTHEQYAKRLGRHFGTTIKGVFTDEPSTCRPQKAAGRTDWHEAVSRALPWSEGLPGFFRKIKKYDLVSRLPDLILDTAGAPGTRKDYWEVVTKMYEEAYFGQIGRWCRKHNIQFFGHTLFEEPLSSMLFYQGDFFRAQRHFDIPGVDNIFGKYGYDEMKGEYGSEPLACKLASSTICQKGGSPKGPSSRGGAPGRVLCEAFAVSPENYTAQDMRRLTDWLGVLGVNMVFAVGYPSAEKRNPKYLKFHDIRKYFGGRELNNYNDYAGRLSFMLTRGVHKANVGMLFPTTSYWMRNNRTFLKGPGWEKMQKGFNALSLAMLKSQIDFDYIFEPALLSGQLRDGKLFTGESAFEAVVIPPVTVLDAEIIKKLELFKAGGGQVILYDLFGGPKERAFCRIASLPALIRRLEPHRTIEIKCRGKTVPDVLYHQRKLKGQEIVFLVNGGGKNWRDAAVTFRFPGAPEIWNPGDGTMNSVDCRVNKGRTCITLSFAPRQSYLIVVNKEGYR